MKYRKTIANDLFGRKVKFSSKGKLLTGLVSFCTNCSTLSKPDDYMIEIVSFDNPNGGICVVPTVYTIPLEDVIEFYDCEEIFMPPNKGKFSRFDLLDIED